MSKLFVKKSVTISAPAKKVWDVLTKPEYTHEWIQSFGITGQIDSTWQLKDKVIWKDQNGQIRVTGMVTVVSEPKMVRFTVKDITETDASSTDEDGITYKLEEGNHKTELHVSQGDFGAKAEYIQYYDPTDKIWDKVLLIIKQLAEK